MTLLKDLIDIPEHIDTAQFVLRLTEGVADPKATVISSEPTKDREAGDWTRCLGAAGNDHLQQAQAISVYYVRVKTEFGGSEDPRPIPLLANFIELLPWLKQWHNEPNANFDGLHMGDYFEVFVNEEARNLGKTVDEIKAWVPPKKVAKASKAKQAGKVPAVDGEK
jgi:hypothetical protein